MLVLLLPTLWAYPPLSALRALLWGLKLFPVRDRVGKIFWLAFLNDSFTFGSMLAGCFIIYPWKWFFTPPAVPGWVCFDIYYCILGFFIAWALPWCFICGLNPPVFELVRDSSPSIILFDTWLFIYNKTFYVSGFFFWFCFWVTNILFSKNFVFWPA